MVALVIAEASGLRSDNPPYALIVAYVVPAFLAQAAFGAILLRAKALPAWIGWTTLAWNSGRLLVLPLVSPGDLYLPILHFVPLLLIGIPLARRASQRVTP